jgi:hypothetical protein
MQAVLEMDKLKETYLVFLTAGEAPRPNNLIASQVLKLADNINKESIFEEVAYVGLVPVKLVVVWFLLGKPLNFNFLREFGIDNKIGYTFFIIGGFFEFLAKDFTAKSDARKVIKMLELEKKSSIIFHCRSYYATQVAIVIKERLPAHNIKILFDMRSLLPPEFFFAMGKWGELLYGRAKEWERWLLIKSDLALMTTRGGIELLKLENPSAKINYIPLIGLDYIHTAEADQQFEGRWQNKKIAYIGSIGYWHSVDIIRKILLYCKKNIAGAEVELITNRFRPLIDGLPHRSIPYSDIADYYKNLLALVVPGRKVDSYFESVQLNINLFSTKAAEAVSAGVPLIVNEDINELAQFVKTHGCGIVFKIKDDEIVLVNCTQSELNDRNFWLNVTNNTIAVSKEFVFDTAMEKYVSYYESL